MGLDLETVVTRNLAAIDHVVEFGPQFFGCIRYVLEPLDQIFGSVQTTQVQISRTVSEPPPHLHKRVVHLGGAQEVADAQTLEGQPPGELVTPDRNDLEPCYAVCIVQSVLGSAVDHPHVNLIKNLR
ncbi:hypothetical protein D9M68_828360 [compost metagenome]